jgi:pimeloyl-ACP methyl ester carboxylesterase
MNFACAPSAHLPLRLLTSLACALAFMLLAGCAGVKVDTIQSAEYLSQRRADVLSSGSLSTATRETLRVLGSEAKPCLADAPACRAQVLAAPGLAQEQRLAALAELWAKEAQEFQRVQPEHALAAWLESARYAWAYLFFSERAPSARAFEDRQMQVRDYYNYATQQAITGLFHQRRMQADNLPIDERGPTPQLRWRQWTFDLDMSQMQHATSTQLPQELLASSSLTFSGLRNIYRREGLGAELVTVFADPQAPSETHSEADTGRALGALPTPVQPFRETRFPAMTGLLEFTGDTLTQALNTHHATLRLLDPYRQHSVVLAGTALPLAGNFTSGYGLWLARSGFSTQALRTLLGLSNGIVRPQIFLMQPYDPNRKVIVMLHGLASSPEAWINVANEVLGDEQLRSAYQIWQVYYPTNAPLALNNYAIRRALAQTLAHFDPAGTAKASHDITLVGHSMGGVLARLMVSDTQGMLTLDIASRMRLPPNAQKQLQGSLEQLLEFKPMPQVGSTIFIAAPHRGTDFANNRIARWVANLITLPLSMLENFSDAAMAVAHASPRTDQPGLLRIPTSIDNLSDQDVFVRATSTLEMAPSLHYHSIIGNDTPGRPLWESSDGIVPYRSAHLPGASSELVIQSGHSAQEAPQAIVEIRRILRSQITPP